jgi:hypothetical protein
MCRKLPVVCQQNIPPSLISSKINVTDPKWPKVPISKNWTIIFFIHPILMHFMENVHLYESPRSQYKNWAKKFHNLEDIYRYNLHISSNFDVWCLSSFNWVRWYFSSRFLQLCFQLNPNSLKLLQGEVLFDVIISCSTCQSPLWDVWKPIILE